MHLSVLLKSNNAKSWIRIKLSANSLLFRVATKSSPQKFSWGSLNVSTSTTSIYPRSFPFTPLYKILACLFFSNRPVMCTKIWALISKCYPLCLHSLNNDARVTTKIPVFPTHIECTCLFYSLSSMSLTVVKLSSATNMTLNQIHWFLLSIKF